MDPQFAMSSWLISRGDAPGYLSCNILGQGSGTRLVYHKPWPRKAFVKFMQNIFQEIGEGVGMTKAHTGHSPKRGGVCGSGAFTIPWM